MDNLVLSGKLSLKKIGDKYFISEAYGLLSKTVLSITSDYFTGLQFLAKCLDYDKSNLSKGEILKTNDVSLSHTPTGKYSIGIDDIINLVELSEEDMEDLMKCLKASEKWKENNLALSYGLEENDFYNGTIRDGEHFSKYVPSFRKEYYGLAVENDGQVRIYELNSSGYWASKLKIENTEGIEHIKRTFYMLQDSMNWKTPIKIISHCGVINYDPREYNDAEVTIGNKKQRLNDKDVAEIIRVISMVV